MIKNKLLMAFSSIAIITLVSVSCKASAGEYLSDEKDPLRKFLDTSLHYTKLEVSPVKNMTVAALDAEVQRESGGKINTWKEYLELWQSNDSAIKRATKPESTDKVVWLCGETAKDGLCDKPPFPSVGLINLNKDGNAVTEDIPCTLYYRYVVPGTMRWDGEVLDYGGVRYDMYSFFVVGRDDLNIQEIDGELVVRFFPKDDLIWAPGAFHLHDHWVGNKILDRRFARFVVVLADGKVERHDERVSNELTLEIPPQYTKNEAVNFLKELTDRCYVPPPPKPRLPGTPNPGETIDDVAKKLMEESKTHPAAPGTGAWGVGRKKDEHTSPSPSEVTRGSTNPNKCSLASGEGYQSGTDRFVLSNRAYKPTDDVQTAIKAAYGENADIADWVELKSILRTQQSISNFIQGLGLRTQSTNNECDNYYVSVGHGLNRDGMRLFLARHDGKPPANWAILDQIGGYQLDLGRWAYAAQAILKISTEDGAASQFRNQGTQTQRNDVTNTSPK